MRGIVIALVIISFLFSCKKKESNIVITGQVTDKKSGQSVSGMTLSLYIDEIQTGSYSNKYELLETVTTDNQGSYTFSNPYKTAEQYKIVATSSNYYTEDTYINPDNLTTANDNSINLSFLGKSAYKIAFKNTSPVNSNDEIIFSVSNTDLTSPDGCGPVSIDLFGQFVDTLVSCSIYAGQDINYTYVVTKNNITNQYSGSTYCPIGDTADITIHY